jgi:hypothetical protein
MRSSVIAIVPNLNTSFKIAGSGDPVGKVVLDHNAGITGVLGEKPRMLPLQVHVRSAQGKEHPYTIELVQDPFLSPILLQMALFSAVDGTERAVGPASYRVRGAVEFSDGLPALRLDNMYSAPSMTSYQLATSAAITLAFLMQSGSASVDVSNIHLEIDSEAGEKSLEIDRVWADRTRVRPGESVRFSAALRGRDGKETVRSVDYRVPSGISPGELNITFSDANSLNFAEWQTIAGGGRPGDLAGLVRAINRLRRNDQLYVRLWRTGQAVHVNMEQLPEPPASVAGVLSLPNAAGGRNAHDLQSVIEELEIGGLGSVVEGGLSMKVTITE